MGCGSSIAQKQQTANATTNANAETPTQKAHADRSGPVSYRSRPTSQASQLNALGEKQPGLRMDTGCGVINLKLRPDAAPITCDYIKKAVQQGFYKATTFYRSDFVIQCGLHGTGKDPPGSLQKNETSVGKQISNTRGTCAIAHWDVPDNGNTEFFINLKSNEHLDCAYGGYCVFAEVADSSSFSVVDKIASKVKQDGNVIIHDVTYIDSMELNEANVPATTTGSRLNVVVEQLGTIPIELDYVNAPNTCSALRQLASAGTGGQLHRAEPIPPKGSSGPPYALVQASINDPEGLLQLPHEGHARITRGMACLIGGASDIFVSLASNGEHDGWEGSMTVFGRVETEALTAVVDKILAMPIHDYKHPTFKTVMSMLDTPVRVHLAM